MKVVLFCGGFGMRLREYSDNIPKPMVNIGYRPILWHVMKYYSFYGHNDFILCLGYKADMIKKYFLEYDETITNDFILSGGGKVPTLLHSDIQDWNITFVDTGINANVGQRLLAVKKYLDSEEEFMGNYTDGVSDVHLPRLLQQFRASDGSAFFLSVRPWASFHLVSTDLGGIVTSIRDVASDTWINGGFFIFRKDFWNYIYPGEELVHEPFQRLIKNRKLVTYKHDGFWACMDTFKEKQQFDDMYARGNVPWEVWRHDDATPTQRSDEC